MIAFYCDEFVLPLPPGHRFPMSKYSRLRRRLQDDGILAPEDLRVPDAATDAQLERVHTRDYVRRVARGELTAAEQRRIGFPWTNAMVERSRRSVGGTIGASLRARDDGVSVNLAGGTHHAFADRGEGFCVFNDAAVGARVAQDRGAASRVMIVDCDVHQGNGTAHIFRDDPTVFTLSVHGARNYPFEKQASDLDVPLDDGCGDDDYLAALETGIGAAHATFDADLAIYLAGADPYEGDRYGRLRLTRDGLAARDRLVLEDCRARRIPVAVVMSGGYARDIDDIVAIHATTVRIAAQLAAPAVDTMSGRRSGMYDGDSVRTRPIEAEQTTS
ncbi:MAG TPA: histone deacetylase [Longimicrobiales bacterium]|nr:histone deacetylase [Longimicrobiales bacterium]